MTSRETPGFLAGPAAGGQGAVTQDSRPPARLHRGKYIHPLFRTESEKNSYSF